MSKSMRVAFLGILVAAVLVVSGCSEGDPYALVIDGQYVWTIGAFGCPVLVGILTQQQTFFLQQLGRDVDWNFTDTDGNSVSFIGTYILDRLRGVLVIVSSGGRRIEADIDMASKIVGGLNTLDGTVSITFDSDGTCGGAWAGNWMIETGVPSQIGSRVFLARGSDGEPQFGIDVLDLDSMTIVATIEQAGGYRMACTPDGSKIYSTSGEELVYVTDTNTYLPITTPFDPDLAFGSTSTVELEAIAVSPDGSRVYVFDEQGEEYLWIIDMATNQVIDRGCYPDTFDFPLDEPENCVVGPNGNFVYMVDNDYAYKIGVNPSLPDYLDFAGFIRDGTSDLSDSHGVALNGAGTKLYVDNGGRSGKGIIVANTSDMSLNKELDCPAGYFISVSHDGNTIFAVDDSGGGPNGGSWLTVIDTTNNDSFQVVELQDGQGGGVRGARGVTDTLDGLLILVATEEGLVVLDRQTLLQTKFMPGEWRDVLVKPGAAQLPDLDPPSTVFGTLIAADRDGNIWDIDANTGVAQFCLDTFTQQTGNGQNIGNVSSMIYNTKTQQIWMGTGDQASPLDATIYSLNPATGQATVVFDNDNSGEVTGHSGMAQRAADMAIFGSAGDNSDFLSINNMTGVASDGGDFGSIDARGQGLTFVGSTLCLASDDELWTVNTSNGGTTLAALLDFSAVENLASHPPEPSRARINSMTTSTAGTIFGLYKIGSGRGGDAATYLVTINPVNGNVTPVGIVPTQVPLDGLTFVPDDLVQCQGD